MKTHPYAKFSKYNNSTQSVLFHSTSSYLHTIPFASVKTRTKEEEAQKFLSDQLSTTRTELSQALRDLSQLYVMAEEIAPKAQWQERLALSLPRGLKETNKKLDGFSQSVLSLKAFKANFNVDHMKGDIERLFDSVIIVTNSKKRKIGEVGVVF